MGYQARVVIGLTLMWVVTKYYMSAQIIVDLVIYQEYHLL